MDIGMRHADIPRQKLRQWDAWLSSSLARRAGYASASLHMTVMSSVTTVCTLTPMEDQHMLVKIAHTMEMITRKGQLRDHHREITLPTLGAISTAVRAPEIEGKLPSLAVSFRGRPAPTCDAPGRRWLCRYSKLRLGVYGCTGRMCA